MIVVLVEVGGATDEIDVLRLQLAMLDKFHHDDEVLHVHHSLIGLFSVGLEREGGKIHHQEQLTGLQTGALLLVLLTLPVPHLLMLDTVPELLSQLDELGWRALLHLQKGNLLPAQTFLAVEAAEILASMTHA